MSGLDGSLRGIGQKHTFNTLDPCALDDNADLDTRGAFNELGPLPQDVGAKDVVTQDALETMAPFFFTSDDV